MHITTSRQSFILGHNHPAEIVEEEEEEEEEEAAGPARHTSNVMLRFVFLFLLILPPVRHGGRETPLSP